VGDEGVRRVVVDVVRFIRVVVVLVHAAVNVEGVKELKCVLCDDGQEQPPCGRDSRSAEGRAFRRRLGRTPELHHVSGPLMRHEWAHSPQRTFWQGMRQSSARSPHPG
jgi:hypothetical protein